MVLGVNPVNTAEKVPALVRVDGTPVMVVPKLFVRPYSKLTVTVEAVPLLVRLALRVAPVVVKADAALVVTDGGDPDAVLDS